MFCNEESKIIKRLEAARQEIARVQDILEEQPAGRQRHDNECRLDRARDVLATAEAASYEGYRVQSEVELIHYLLTETLKNLR
jgi:hypothetical protein